MFLNFKMSAMYVNHSRVAVDLEKILQCGSAESKKALFFPLAKTFFRASKNGECLIVACRRSSVNCRGSRVKWCKPNVVFVGKLYPAL